MKQHKYRHELKYLISELDYYSIKNRLKHILKPDKNVNHKGQYQIRSLYFDNYNNQALFEKIAGFNTREKFRIRLYNLDDSFIRLENKCKHSGYTLKTSAKITKEECQKILEGDYDCLIKDDDPLRKEFHHKLKNQCLKPSTIVDYTREAYVYPAGNVRITFDMKIRTGLSHTEFLDPTVPTVPAFLKEDVIVLEVKFDNFIPTLIKSVIQTNHTMSSAASKYVMCRNYY